LRRRCFFTMLSISLDLQSHQQSAVERKNVYGQFEISIVDNKFALREYSPDGS